MKNLSKVILSALMFVVSSLAAGMEVNILSERQELLLKPFLEQFEKRYRNQGQRGLSEKRRIGENPGSTWCH